MRISTQAKLISTALAAVAIAAPIAHGETDGTLPSGSYPQLKTGEGFSFKAPSYWNAAPSYWRTAERTLAPRTPRRVNRSLGVPPQYLGAGTQTVTRALPVSANRSLGVPLKYKVKAIQATGTAGFDWSSAAIGAGTVAGFLLMIAAIGAMTIKARKSQRAGRLSAT
jgi:hypothetical protein